MFDRCQFQYILCHLLIARICELMVVYIVRYCNKQIVANQIALRCYALVYDPYLKGNGLQSVIY